MTFSDLNFIFRAMPLFLIIYYIFPVKARPWMLLLASLVFYALNDLTFLALLAGATVVNYLLAKLVLKKNKPAFVVALIFNAALLIGFKVASRLDLGIAFPFSNPAPSATTITP